MDSFEKGTQVPEKFFCAGIFMTPNEKEILIVEDVSIRDGIRKTNRKMPGGMSDAYAFYDKRYIETLEHLLSHWKFSKPEIYSILEIEDKRSDVYERVLVAEYLEETGYYPYEFEKIDKDFSFKKEDWVSYRFFFHIKKLVQRHPNPNDFIKTNKFLFVDEIYSTNIGSLDFNKKDNSGVVNSRLTVSSEEAFSTLCLSHKYPWVEFVSLLTGSDKNSKWLNLAVELHRKLRGLDQVIKRF